MVLKRFFDEKLAQASYLVGCPACHEAAVIDPNRDVEAYISAAAADGLSIVAVTETHIHADFVSGARELAERTGARLYLSAEGGKDWSYAFAGADNVRLVRDGDEISLGEVKLKVVHTPGHTPEHLCFLLIDGAASPEPCCAFTGDFVFVGDVGRPDLLERAAGVSGTMEVGARSLFHSLDKLLNLPGHLLLWPGHGAGSACGKALGNVPATTLGYERATNWAFRQATEEDFVSEVLNGQPEPPGYFADMKRINREGPSILGGFLEPPRVPGSLLSKLTAEDTLILDLREPGVVALGFLPGSINVPLGKSFSTYAGSVLSKQPLYLLAHNAEDAKAAARDLAMIGFEDVRGWLGTDVLDTFERERGPLDCYGELAPRQLSDENVFVLDVRGRVEHEESRIPGAVNIPLPTLGRCAEELPKGRKIAVHCGAGTRSAIAITLLKRLGFEQPVNVTGGMVAYEMAGLPVEKGPESVRAAL